MKHAANVDPKPKGGIIRIVLALIVFLAGAVLLFMVLTGRLGSRQDPYADGDAAETQEAAQSDEVTPQASLAEYSWKDLSSISSEISAAGSREAALEIAKSYNLVTSDGAMTGDTKEVELSDGSTITVELADIYHDDKSDGSGKAGLTFICASSIGQHAMNSTGTIDGGWESSEMRSWLASDVLSSLPEDLSGVILQVNKMTNNTGSTSDAASVTATSDTLWLLSAREVCGTVDWFAHEYGANYASYDDVCNGEGEQYALFSQAGVGPRTDPNGALKRVGVDGAATAWFYRSAMNYTFENIEGSFFYEALDSGYPYGHAAPETAQGVVFGFCV